MSSEEKLSRKVHSCFNQVQISFFQILKFDPFPTVKISKEKTQNGLEPGLVKWI